MAVDVRKPLQGGLDLGVDRAQTAGLVLADGMRFDINGVLTPRLGRVFAGLDFPDENVGDPDDYVQTIAAFQSQGRLRGLADFYDQRVQTEPPEILSEPELETVTDWTLAGGWTHDSVNGRLLYNHNAGPNTVTQNSADFVTGESQPIGTYVFEYTVGNTIGITTFTVRAGASPIITLDTSVGRHSVQWTTDNTVSNLVIDITSSGGDQLFLYSVSLKPVVETPLSLPQRLNHVHKTQSSLWLNDTKTGVGDSITNTVVLDGDGSFNDPNSKAKILTRSRAVYIIDRGTRPKIMRPLPDDEQTLYKRVKYDVRPFGIEYPRSSSDIPILTQVSGVGTSLPESIIRFRMALENKMGDTSAPTLTVGTEMLASNDSRIDLAFPQIPDDLTSGPNEVKNWKLYASVAPKVGDSIAREDATEFRFWKRVPITDTSASFSSSDYTKQSDAPLIDPFRRASPKLRDFIIINDIGYGISDYDVISAEEIDAEGDPRATVTRTLGGGRVTFPIPAWNEYTFVRRVTITPDIFFISQPAEPHILSTRVKFGRTGEEGVGVSELGDKPVVFTNKGILIWDPETFSMRRTASEVGAMSRDGIVRTEQGIRFIASDGVPRLFNGVNVEEVGNEVLPIFDKEDYAGDYKVFDRQYASEVSATSGNRRFYMTYPVGTESGNLPEKPTLDPIGTGRNLLVLDSSDIARRGSLTSIDKRSIDEVRWLARESRLLGVESDGSFYYLEEGLTDANVSGTTAPSYDMKLRWYGGENAGMTVFETLRIEIDTKQQNLALIVSVDGDPDLTETFVINTTKREHWRTPLPGTFKGLYMEARLTGVYTSFGRPELYDLQVKSTPMGVF
jgi:hypothetical protein